MSSEIRGSSILILGYGREGQSTHRYLMRKYPELKIGVADRQNVTLISDAPSDTTRHTGDDYLKFVHNYETIIVSPGIKLPRDIAQGKFITSATNIFFSKCSGKTIGVTGTKGKSTTSSLIAAILSEHFSDVRLAGNIGNPMLDTLQGSNEETVFVLELSSFQLKDIRYSPNVAVLLGIVPEHLDYHESFENYVSAKANLVRFQKRNDIIIYNSGNEALKFVSELPSQKAVFGVEGADCTVVDSAIQTKTGDKIVQLEELPLIGPGNLQNVMAGITCGLSLGVPVDKIRKAVTNFKGLPHRLEFVGEVRGIKFINDSLSTIPEALVNALIGLGPDVETLIAGGHDRGIDFAPVGPVIAESNIKNLILFPDTGEKIWNEVCKCSGASNLRRFDVSTMEEAVNVAFQHTTPGRICVLSPASSSFNLFQDYRERGESFKACVGRKEL